MKIDVRKSDGVTILECAGQITYGPGKVTLRDTFIEQLTSGERKFVLSLLDVPYLDTPSLGEIVACWKRAAEAEGVFKVVLEPGGRVDKLFRLTGFDKVFELHGNVEAAVASYGREPVSLLFPNPPRSFTGQRAVRIALRAAHVLCSAVVVGGVLLATDRLYGADTKG